MDPDPAEAGGTWSPLANKPPTSVNSSLLLSDGTVLTYDGNGNCCKLTPDIHGSYINGTWTKLAVMNDTRLFFSSQLLTNGLVFVAGGEDGAGHDHAELYDPLNNVWKRVPDPVPAVGFSDSVSEILPNGNVLIAPVGQFGGCVIYNVPSNSWQNAAGAKNQNETCWVKLPNDTILTVDTGAQTSEHYVPSINQWIVDGNVPIPIYGYGAELGAGFLLPNGKVFYIGATNNTAIYTPGATPTSAGSWVAGAMVPNNLGAVDAPAAMMVNGKILCDLGPNTGFNGPCSFYEYDYISDTFTRVSSPTGGSTLDSAPFANSMLDLPDGTVLFISGQNTTQLYVYTPDGSPLAAGQPAISNITENADGTYKLTGTGLNGISEGAAYGDDEQMGSNYPLVRMTNAVTGNVYYARTFNWNSTSVMTSNRLITAQFSLPQNLPAGTYSLVTVANGNASDPTNFVYSPPPLPTGLAAFSGSNGFVNVQWSPSAGATAYNLKRSATSTGYFSTIATVGGTNFTDTRVTNGITYFYKVSAVGPNGPSSDSSAVSATPIGPPPAPGNLAAIGGQDGMVTLSWSPSYGASSYLLQRSTVNGGPYTAILNLNVTNFVDSNVTNGVTYYYVVAAMNTNGISVNSAQVSAVPTSPVLIAWFKADALNLANGSSITTWPDSTGHGFNATQGTVSHQPQFITGSMNGLPVVRFTSANSDTLRFTRPVQDSFTIFCVFRSTQGLNSGNQFYQGAGLVNGEVAGAVNDFGTCLFADGHVCAGTGNPDVAINSAGGFNDGNPHLMTFRRSRSSGQVDLFMDGKFVGTTVGSTNLLTSPAQLALGSIQTGINFLTGDMAEVQIFNSALSDADRARTEGALFQKWGFSLPAAPTGVTATAGEGLVQLNWNAYPTATNYIVLRSTANGGPYTAIGSTGTTNYVDATVVNGVTYYYVISAMNTFTQSGNSAQVSATPIALNSTVWLKADAITNLANGATVASWGDSSGNGFNATQVTLSQRPTFVRTAINGMPTIHFNSAGNNSLSFTRPVQDDFTIVCVFRSSQGLNTGNLYYQGAGIVNGEVSGNANDFGSCLFANGVVCAGTGNPDVATNSAPGFNDGNPHIMTFRRVKNTGEIDLYMDGNFAGTTTGNTNSLTAPSKLTLAAQQTGINFLNGDISEVKVFNSALSDLNRKAEESALECKYAIGFASQPFPSPTGLNGVWRDGQVTLDWIGVSGATQYAVGYSLNPNGPFTILTNAAATTFVDTQAVIGATNYYQVTAVSSCNSSAPSAAIGVFLPQPVVGIVGNPDNSITITWPSWANNWNLYSATNLTPPVFWTLVTNAPSSNNNQLSITIPIGQGDEFFELSPP